MTDVGARLLAARPDLKHLRALDVTRARDRFGFVAQTPFDVGLARTIAWWRERGA